MWKRLPMRERGKEGQVQISGPTLVESTYDYGQLEHAKDAGTHNNDIAPNAGGHGYSGRTRLSASCQNSDQSTSTLPAPLELQTSSRISSHAVNRASVAASSIYSQPSPEMNYQYPDSMHATPANFPTQDYHQISPPTSSHLPTSGHSSTVSPLDEQSASFVSSTRPQISQIPIPRKASAGVPPPTTKRAPPAKAWTQNVGKGSPMMWDKYSGEPTLTGTGVPAQVKPGGSFNLRSQLRPVANRTYQPPAAENEAPHREIFREKASRYKQGLTVDTKPSWKGASGRQAIIAPPQDKPGQAIPVPARQQVQSPNITPPTDTMTPTLERISETTRVGRAETANVEMAGHERINLPEPPTTGRGSPRQHILATQASREFNRTDYPSPVSPADATPTQETHDQRSFPTLSESPESIYIPKRRESRVPTDRDRRSNSHQPNLSRDPTSRFSWTTVETTTTYQQDSPPPSPPPPMPHSYIQNYSPSSMKSAIARVSADTAPTVLNRGHPTRRLGEQSAGPPSPTFSLRSMSSTIRKAVPSEQPIRSGPLPDWRDGLKVHRAPGFYRSTPSISPSTTSAMGDKTLPKTPRQLSSVDLITALQAQQDDLFNQRMNIQRVIRSVEKHEAQNPLVSDIRARREKEKRLGALKDDLAEVAREEYETGLRLHRAWKRREKEDPSSGPSVLWVRRVTNGL